MPRNFTALFVLAAAAPAFAQFSLTAPTAEHRGSVALRGEWQIARFDEDAIVDRTEPVRELPDLGSLRWLPIRVPGSVDSLREDFADCHRYLYRCTVEVPPGDGRGYLLRFPSTCLIASVFVNGRFVAGNDTPCAAWDADCSAAVRPGETNTIVVAVKDYYYAVARTDKEPTPRPLFTVPRSTFHEWKGLPPSRFADYPVLFKVRRHGILETPTLFTTGPIFVTDVFAIPSVKHKQLTVETTLRNSTGRPAEVRLTTAVGELDGGGPAEVLRFEPRTVTVPAGGEATVRQRCDWPGPRLWWPDDPHQYQAVVRAESEAGTDIFRQKFGFREWGWQGQCFTLNGVPWRLRADTSHHDRRESVADAERAVAAWKAAGMNFVRFWGEQPWLGDSQRDTLDFFDRTGMIVRRSGIFDGEVASYQLVDDGQVNRPLFDNWVRQLKAWVRAERNHPSVIMWSLENEITYINARNFGWLNQVEPEIRRAAEAVMELDPTRPAMIDGGDALRDRSLPVYGNHYLEGPFRDYPDEAYTLAKAYRKHETSREDPWPIDRDKPLILGESFYANGRPPGAYAELVGDAAFLGWPEANHGVARFARRLAEGYRWHGVAGFQFWFSLGAPADHHIAFRPVAVFCREYDRTFAADATAARTLKLFNDTRHPDPIVLEWADVAAGGSPTWNRRECRVPPGEAVEVRIELPPTSDEPDAAGRASRELRLRCLRGGAVVFEDVKPFVRLHPRPSPATQLAAAGPIAVYDPLGPVRQRLAAQGVPFVRVFSPDDIPPCRVLLVGPDALTARLAGDPRWAALAATGARIVFFDQSHPLSGPALPAEMPSTPHAGRVAFPESATHPAFAGLEPRDFDCWSGDHVVYRNAYRKPTRGARSLAQCDEELGCAALAEVPVRDGLLVVCQFAVGDKLGTDPVAGRLTDNLIRHAATYEPPAKRVASLLPADDPRTRLLAATGVRFTRPDAPAAAWSADIVVLDAADLPGLDAPAVKAFTERGGWLIVWGVSPETLPAFNALVGFPHAIRPFRRERVALPPKRDPLTAGLTQRDVVLESPEKIFPWAGARMPADDVFTHVVDLDDVAPFLEGQPGVWSQLTNGLTSADAWVFILYHDLQQQGDRPAFRGRLAKEEEVAGLELVVNGHYRRITKVRLVFDHINDTALTLDVKPEPELVQRFEFPPRRCREISLEPIAWDGASDKPVIGLDTVRLFARRPATFARDVVPLLNIGALVKYPRGRGGIVLNQLRAADREANPVNAQKKAAMTAALLRNLGAAFAPERSAVVGVNLAYRPVALGEKCNGYLTTANGWPGGSPDLSHFPVGEQVFAGVPFEIRDFRTSPLPACVTVQEGRAVTGLPVEGPADALLFLHTLHQTRETNARRGRAETPAWTYRVRYADGEAIELPVRPGSEVGHWIAAAPESSAAAAVAWSAPFPKEPSRHAVVYLWKWDNPRPAVPLAGLDVVGVEKGKGFGSPIVLGVTAAAVVD